MTMLFAVAVFVHKKYRLSAADLTFRCRILFSAKMSNRRHSDVDSKFIVSCFQSVCQVEACHHRWMTADTWAKLICSSGIKNELHFTGDQLVKALSKKENAHLRVPMQERNNIPRDHIGVFRDLYKPKL